MKRQSITSDSTDGAESVSLPVSPDFWDRLAELEPVRERPPDSFTIQEYAKRFGVSPRTAANRVMALVEKGIVRGMGRTGREKFYVMVPK